MRPRTTLAAAPAAALLALAACAEPPTPTAAGGPGGDSPTLGELMADGHQDHSCAFVWEELPFEDDSIIPHPIESYDAEVWTVPLT